MRKIKIIGLTGQSGAGKSTVAEVLEESGFTVINADRQVAEIYKTNPVCLKAVAASFGSDIIGSDGSINRALLAERAFSSAENTALLGKTVHPFVFADTLARLKKARGFVVLDAPQLFESNIDAVCDCVVSVVADKKLRLERITERDGLTREKAEERLNAQLDEEFFVKNSDYIIFNNSDKTALVQKTRELAGAIKEVM